MPEEHDVVVAGCGPVGLCIALLLARQGHRVAVVERHLAIYALPRAIAFDHEIARILHGLGLMEPMKPHLAAPGKYQWRNANGETLFVIDWSEDAVSGFRNSYFFSQPKLEQVMNAAAQANPLITIHRGYEMIGFRQDEEGVSLTARRVAASDSELTLCGRYLIGADGANSGVRAGMGAKLTDLGFEADWLVVDVLPLPGERLPFDDDLAIQICDPARPTTMISGGPGRRRWEFMALEGETLADLNSDERAWELLRPFGLTPQNALLERHAIYTFRGAVADRWRQGRVFIAGDAAHLTPPFAGQGLCAGFRDAAALAWRLDLALRGLASEAMLASYGAERTEHARAWIMNAIDLGEVICVLDPAVAAERDARMLAARAAGATPPSSLILPRLGPGMSLPDQAGGALGHGGALLKEGRRAHIDDLLGGGFQLISRLGDPASTLSPAAYSLFAALHGVSVDLSPSSAIRDIDGVYTRWFDKLDADTVLLRPDFYLFGAATGKAGAEALMQAFQSFVTVSRTPDPSHNEANPMSVTEEGHRDALLAKPGVRPSSLAHVVLRTTRYEAMRDFYLQLLNGRVTHENGTVCFMTYDEEHHRVVVIDMPHLAPVQPKASGLEHYSFTYASMGELLGNYARLKAAGILPVWTINHGFTTSIYYRDPDGNMIETQFDNMTSEEANAFMHGRYFAQNPIGVDFDPEVLLARYRAGDPLDALIQFRSAPYADGVEHIRPASVGSYDGEGALL
jgi:2-polyprenyl-6-methoxyphenol hydroxylase-like FAD-dependent oxidoreductase/catechol 2,3-dioxygenase-like lactoylglutathione lyase family enzyme